ncbi:membrane protein insertase YidC [Paracoccaceae bacterium GXU_MW_L88]
MDNDDSNKNLFLAIALSLAVIIGWQIFFPAPEPATQPDSPATEQSADTSAAAPNVAGAPAATAPVAQNQTVDEALGTTERVEIDTPRLTGSLSLRGGRIDDLALKDYRETVNPSSPLVRLLSPVGSPVPYYALHGWTPAGGGLTYENVPTAQTDWSLVEGSTLSVGSPVTLEWDNGAGLIFRKTISVDENYLFTVEQSVENTTGEQVSLAPYGTIARHGEPDTQGFYLLHEGVIAAEDGVVEEINYDDMPDFDTDPREQAAVEATAVQENGWIGFTDKYWMTTLVPQPGQAFTAVAKYTPGSDTYQTDSRLPVVNVAAGDTAVSTTHLFAGAKEWAAIRNYERENGFVDYVNSIDWGWFWFFTKPIFRLLHSINEVIGNMGWSIIALTFILKAIVFPLSRKSYVSMARMKELQPELEKIKERAGDDRMKMQQEMMALYREKKVNPAAGCLPMLIQIPIFFSLYKVLFVTIEMRHAPFIGWIRDLSAPDPSSVLNLFGLLPWAPPPATSLLAFISLGVFPILMGVTMWLQQKLNPAPTDKTQATIFNWMPVIFTFMLGRFAVGLVIYWTANNVITFLQQYFIMRSHGYKPDIWGNIRGKGKT